MKFGGKEAAVKATPKVVAAVASNAWEGFAQAGRAGLVGHGNEGQELDFLLLELAEAKVAVRCIVCPPARARARARAAGPPAPRSRP